MPLLARAVLTGAVHDKRASPATGMIRMLAAAALLCCLGALFASPASAQGVVVEPLNFSDGALLDRYLRLVRELRCPKCQNQNLYTSDAPLAADLRRELKRMLEAGDDDDEIVRFMTARYGEFVRYRPGLSPATAIVWLAPGILLLFGATLAWRRLTLRAPEAVGDGGGPPPMPDSSPDDEPAWARRAAWAWIPLAFALAAALYWNLGAWPELQLAERLRVDDWRSAAPMLERRVHENPQDLDSMSLLGSAYAHLRRPEDAIRVWREALRQVPADSQPAAQLRMGIAAMSRSLAGPASDSGAAIDVGLRLAEGFSVPAGLTVYVFARAVGESAAPMPLAVVRTTSQSLPTRVTLSDRHAMIPSMRLSSAKWVQVTARVSLDGDVAAGPGDWQGVSEVVELRDGPQGIDLLIDTLLPAEPSGL